MELYKTDIKIIMISIFIKNYERDYLISILKSVRKESNETYRTKKYNVKNKNSIDGLYRQIRTTKKGE